MGNYKPKEIYDFIDDGINKSIYTILNGYFPFLERDFSLASLINHMPDINYSDAERNMYMRNYEGIVEETARILLERTKDVMVSEEISENENEGKVNPILAELRKSCEGKPECKSFTTIKEYVEYAKRTIYKPETKPLRDVIVKNAVNYLSQDEIYESRERLIKNIYFLKAESKVKAVNHKSRTPGEYPEWDDITDIRRILYKKNGLKEYDEFYHEASKKIKEAVLAAMQEAKIATICETKRRSYVSEALKPTKTKNAESGKKEDGLFKKLKRKPQKEENSWSYVPLEKPELLCDLEADYSEGGIENQRVIAFRYGRFKYEKTNPDEFNVDRAEMMPELVGISRIGKDGTKTYFVLMPPIDRLKYRDADDKSIDSGDKLLKFTITDDVKVPVLFNKSKTVRKSFNANVVDEKTGKPINIFRNKNIPKQLEEFFAKVYFSDEYLSSAIEKNARYLGSVKEGEDGPYIETADEDKVDLAAAYYAEYFPGIVKGKQVENLSKYCNSGDLAIKQFELIRKIRESEREAELRNKTTRPKDEGQGFDD